MTRSLKKSAVTLQELIIYPLKGGRGISVESCIVTASGLLHDRAFMLNDPDGQPITEKSHVQLAKLVLSVRNETVYANAPGMPEIELYSSDAPSWFSQLLGFHCALTATNRDNQFEAQPISLVSNCSIVALNRVLARPFDRLRYRPNLVVDTSGLPFSETGWQSLGVKEARLLNAGAIIRPHMLSADLPWSQARIAGKKACRALVTSPSGHLIFGNYMSIETEGVLCVGDILSTQLG